MSVGQTGGSERGSWSALLDEATAEEVENLDFFDDIGARIAGARAPDTGGANLGAPGRAIAAVTILAGRSRASPLLEQVAPLLPAVIQELMPLPGKPRRLDAFWTLSYLNAARCAASVVPDSATTAENAWLPELATMREHFSDPERHTLALAACACAQVALVPAMLGVRSLPVFAPGETFGFNVQGFTLYLAAAIAADAQYEDVEMAWLEFVHNFPIKLDTEMLDWPALLWAARAVYATIGGIVIGEVGDELHRLVTGA